MFWVTPLRHQVKNIDRYPGGYSSIDVMSENILFKHFSLTDVIEHVESRTISDLITSFNDSHLDNINMLSNKKP